MDISACMKRNVISINQRGNIAEAGRLFVDRHIGTLPVVDDEDILVGLIQLRDLLALVMPDFIKLVEDFGFVHDFGVLERRQPEPGMLNRPVGAVMESPVAVQAGTGLVRAAAMLQKYRLQDIPVVDPQGHLLGIASRVDIGTALIASWFGSPDRAS